MDRWLKKRPSILEVTSDESDRPMPTEENRPETAASEDVQVNKEPNIEKSIKPPSYTNQKSKIKKIKTISRKYSASYLKFGFTRVGEDAPLPQCVICSEILSNQSMKPSHLQRHLFTKHSALKNKPEEYFQCKLLELKQSQTKILNIGKSNIKSLEASFRVSLRIARAGKAHTIGEELILPATKDIVSLMINDSEAKKIDLIPLSNDTVTRRISDMASDVKDQLIKAVKKSPFFALQLDESTDVSNLANVLVFVRYEAEMEFKEEFLFCESLSTRTTGHDIFQLINNFLTTNEIGWENCIGICSDGARAMVGRLNGFLANVKEVMPTINFTHCMIHREALATKKIGDNLKNVMNKVVKVVNFIKSRALNSRVFTVLCTEMGSAHSSLLLHTEVRWLSRGKILTRVFELRSEIQLFLSGKNEEDFHDCFLNEEWLCRLAYLSDIFSRLNDLNLSLQGSNTNPFIVHDKIRATIKKLQHFSVCIKNGKTEAFATLDSFICENNINLKKGVILDIDEHCTALAKSLQEYFPETLTDKEWIRNPFVADVENYPDYLSMDEKENLIELSCDQNLRLLFSNVPLQEFWLQKVRKEYPSLSDKAVKFLLPFTTTYLCETAFSTLTYIKNKYRSRLNVEPDLRLKLSKIEPDVHKLCRKKQAHPSH